MNKLMTIILIIAAVFVCATANAAERVNGSGSKSADALIYAGEGGFQGIVFALDGTNACTVSVYDSTSATGTLLMPTTVMPTSSTTRSQGFYFNPPVQYNTGIYVDITVGGGGSCSYVVYTVR